MPAREIIASVAIALSLVACARTEADETPTPSSKTSPGGFGPVFQANPPPSAKSLPELAGEIAVVSGRQAFGLLAVLDASTGDMRTLSNDSFDSVEVAWSRDGSTLALATGGYIAGQIALVSAETGKQIRGIPFDDQPISVDWSPDGSTLVFVTASTRLWTVGADGSAPRRIPTGSLRPVHVARSPDRATVAATTDQGKLVLFHLDGGQPTVLVDPDEGRAWFRPAWSSDGSRIAFSMTVDGVGQLFVVNRDGTGLEQLTTGPDHSTSPTWSPDDAWIAFARRDGHQNDLFAVASDGSATTRLTRTEKEEYGPDWRS
jgi:Tol biopolymer transport system component